MKRKFLVTTPETTKQVMGVDTEAAVDNTTLTAGDRTMQLNTPATKEQATKDRNLSYRYKPWFTCCRLSQSNKIQLSYS